jgi:hypothetical protein
VRGLDDDISDGQRRDFIERHGAVSVQTPMLGCHLSGPVLKAPGRIREDGVKALAADHAAQFVGGCFGSLWVHGGR